MANVTYIAPAKVESVMHKLRCAAYCRVSSNSEDQLNSYAAQVKYFSEMIIGSDTEELVDIYADEGITGTSADKRTEFQRLIKDCKRGKIDRVYTKSISRFARNTKDCLNTVRLLRELGISIYFEKENIDTAKTNDELMLTVMGGLAQEESTSISQNMRWSARKQMEKGTYKQRTAPFGYKIENGKLIVDKDESKVVRMIFNWYLSGIGTTQIKNRLTIIYENKKWNHALVRYILSNEKYIGDTLFEKSYKTDTIPSIKRRNKGEKEQFYIANSHEPIVSRGEFEKVQIRLAGLAQMYHRRPKNKHIFSSVLKCSKCGTGYKRKLSGENYYWTCLNHDRNSNNCGAKPILETTIKQTFISMCNKLIQHYREILLPLRRSLHELNMQCFSRNAHIIDIHKKIADIKEQRHVISRLHKKGFLDEKKYNEKLTELESELSRQTRKLKKLAKSDNEDDTLEQLDLLIDIIEKQDDMITVFDEELFGIIVERIIVRDKSLEFILISGLSFKENI